MDELRIINDDLVEFLYLKQHQGYVDKLNNFLEKAEKDLESGDYRVV